MPVITPAMGTPAVGGQPKWIRFVRRLATRPSSEVSLVYVPDGTHDRLAVLKRLPHALATDPTAVEKFRVEARIAAMLEHPSIVRVYEVVESTTDEFYTMEYVRGADMRQLMDALVEQKRTLPLDCVLLIAIELCNALDYAHHLTDANGLPAPILHRELSPSKVLLGVDGSIKLTGFAAPPVTRSNRPRRSRTESVGYTPPERFLGETQDARSDVFALGVLLYELSTGEQLFADAANEHQIMTKLVRGDLPRPSEIRRGYPRELEAILMRALAKDRKERHESASALQAELETFLWSRWPTASTSALAKLVATTFPSPEDADLATGSRELERIDPFAANAAPPSDEPILWLGPVPLAKPYPRVGEGPRTDTKDLQRLAPQTFPDASNVDLTLGAPGPKARREDLKRQAVGTTAPATVSERAETIDELAIPVEQPIPADSSEVRTTLHLDVDELLAAAAIPVPPAKPGPLGPFGAQQKTVVKPTPVVLGTPGPKPAPLGAEPSPRARAFSAVHAPPQTEPAGPARGQYQRPEALDERGSPDDAIIERLRAKKRGGEEPNRSSSTAIPRAKTSDRLSSANVFRTGAHPVRRVSDAPSGANLVRTRTGEVSPPSVARTQSANSASNPNLARTWNGDEADNPGTSLGTGAGIARTSSNTNLARTWKGDEPANPGLVRTRSQDIEIDLSAIDDDDGVTVARTRTSEESQIARLRGSDANIARVAIARVVTPIGLVRADYVRPAKTDVSTALPLPASPTPTPMPFEPVKRAETASVEAQAEFDLDKVSQLNWTLIPSAPPPSPVDVIRQRLPSPPLAAIASGRKAWPLGTIAAIVGVVVVGVLASVYAIRSTQHESSDLPEVVTALPSPPMDVVLHTTQKARPAVGAAITASDARKSKASRTSSATSTQPAPASKKEHVRSSADRPADTALEAKEPKEPRESREARESRDAKDAKETAKEPKKVIPPLFPPPDRLPVAPGSLDGLPAIKTIEVKGTTADLAIRKAMEQALSPLRACYRMAARAKQVTPQVDLTIAFDIDARRVPIKVHAIGGGPLDALASCATRVTSEIRDLPAPASGAANVRVSVSLEFRPNP